MALTRRWFVTEQTSNARYQESLPQFYSNEYSSRIFLHVDAHGVRVTQSLNRSALREVQSAICIKTSIYTPDE